MLWLEKRFFWHCLGHSDLSLLLGLGATMTLCGSLNYLFMSQSHCFRRFETFGKGQHLDPRFFQS